MRTSTKFQPAIRKPLTRRTANALRSAVIFAAVLLLGWQNYAVAYMDWNQACAFAGNSTSYISAPNTASLNITGSITLEAWIYQDDTSPNAKGIVAKGGALGTTLRYALRLTNGRINFLINGATRLITKTSTFIQPDTWTHVSATYNSSTGTHSIYINGVLDSTSTYASAAPASNTDSLFIGISGNSSPFNGRIDELRIWNRALTAGEVGLYFRSIIATSSGSYQGLVMSLPFQKQFSTSPFTLSDFSGLGNLTLGRNITPVSYAYDPSNTISTNQAVRFFGNNDYLAGKDTATIEPTNAMTLDLWVYPMTVQSCNLITKGSQYSLSMVANTVSLTINGVTAVSSLSLPLARWSRLTVSSTSNSARFFLNGLLVTTTGTGFGSIPAGSDSLYIGGVPGATGDFNGMLDEVRIQKRLFLSEDSVFVNTYKALDLEFDLTSNTEVCYNFDGYLKDNEGNGGPDLHFRNNALFSNPATDGGVAVTPLFRSYDASVQEGFYLPSAGSLNQTISPTGTSTTTMTIPIHITDPISSIEVMAGLNHSRLSDLTIDVIAPNGDSARLMSGIAPLGNDNSIRAIFTDIADSTIGTLKYASISGIIKPLNNMTSVFGGDNPLGLWRVLIKDNVTGFGGIAHVCGIRVNGMLKVESNFSFTAYYQGRYNPSTNLQSGDTATLILRNFDNPAIIYDSAKAQLSQIGQGRFSFTNIPYDARCYLQMKHRNSIETWGSQVISFNRFSSSYLMHLSAIAAFGNNLAQVDTSPVAFAVYSGDCNQDGTVDATDLSMIDNDAQNFLGGYVVTDLTGDDFVDGTDFAIADNNATNFVSAVVP
ncbi:MAG: hypothetical protein K1X85_00760 [Ignavibacteria bacterium]|nr:hypothetical protein [Ignavibacteria bacterium]